MISIAAAVWCSCILAQPSFLAQPSAIGEQDGSAALPPRQELPEILQTIDWFVAAAGVALLLLFALRSAQPRNKALRLELAPQRTNRFGEDSVLIAMLAYLVTAAGLAWILNPAEPDAAAWRALAVDTVARVAGILACALLANTRVQGGSGAFLLRSPQLPAFRSALLILSGAVIAMGVCPLIHDGAVWVFQQFAPEFAPKSHATLERLEKSKQAWMIAWLWISAGLIAPLAEEIFFRGVLQSALVNILRSRWLGIALASVAFGAVHFPQPQAVVPLMAMGFVLGYLYERTGSLSAPIVVHVLFNLKTLVWHQISQG